MTISPIETRYAGCRFRSRTEARWAVFLDKLEIVWEYEAQGFRLPSGARYLPDFKLPDLKVFLEVKGAEPTEKDLEKVREFATAAKDHGYVVLLLVGDVPRPAASTTAVPARAVWVRRHSTMDVSTQWRPAPPEKIREALTAARSARFEFGESG